VCSSDLARIWRERLRARLTLGNALSNVSLVFRKISSDHRQIELPQDAGIRFALEQETETFCDQLIARNIRPAQSNPISFL